MSTLTDIGFKGFLASVGPKVRPPETLARLRRAFALDVGFEEEFALAKPYLAAEAGDWAETQLRHLTAHDALPATIDAQGVAVFKRLVDAHMRQTLHGKFDAHWLDTLEPVALFYIYHDVKSIWVAGAHHALTGRAVDRVAAEASRRGARRVPQLVKALLGALALELNQMQRVYTMAERIGRR